MHSTAEAAEIAEERLPVLTCLISAYSAFSAVQSFFLSLISSYTVKLHLLDDRRLAVLVEGPV
jgi:hypothetical protein